MAENIRDIYHLFNPDEVLFSMLTKMLEKAENDEIDHGVTSTQLSKLFWMRRTCCNNRWRNWYSIWN